MKIETMRKRDEKHCIIQEVNLAGVTYVTDHRVEIFEVELSRMFAMQTNQDARTDKSSSVS